MESFKEFVNAGAFSNTGFNQIDNQMFGIGHALNLPTPTLDMPTKTLQGNVRRINYTENPISIQLDSGAVWNLTKKQWDYLRTVNKEPRVNSAIQIEMYLDGTIKSVNINQRNYTEKSIQPNTKESNKKSSWGRSNNKAEKTFAKKHLPF
jgi:hypothetical protein